MEIEKPRNSGARSRSQSWSMDELYVSATDGSKRSSHADADEEALKLASLHKLPTFDRLRTAFLASYNTDDIENQHGDHQKNKQVNVRELGANDQQQIINKLFKVAEVDNEKFLTKLRERFDRFLLTFISSFYIYIVAQHVNLTANKIQPTNYNISSYQTRMLPKMPNLS